MKLFVWSKVTRAKIYLTFTTRTREELAQYFGNEWFIFTDMYDINSYHVKEVFAECPVKKSFISLVAGGGIGVIGGPVGVLFGAAAGYYLGNGDSRKVDEFNAS